MPRAVTLNIVIKRQISVTEFLQQPECIVVSKVFKLHQRSLSVTTTTTMYSCYFIIIIIIK